MRAVTKWRRTGAKERNVFVTCPGCATEYRLDHDVSQDGKVTPSLECPDEGCGFHDMVLLVGWNGGAVKRQENTEGE